jgi:hypothetical protein
MRSADWTAFPGLFRRTYWGSSPQEPSADVIANRNAFAEEHGGAALKQVTAPQYVRRAAFGGDPVPPWGDHLEVYSAAGYYVVVVSPYMSEEMVTAEAPGFTVIPPMYDDAATTATLRVEKRRRRLYRHTKMALELPAVDDGDDS